MKPQPLASDTHRFIFLWWRDQEYGVLLGEQYYDFMKRFHESKSSANTWAQFMSGLGENGANYVKPFLAVDDRRPKDDDLLDGLVDHVFILSDCEFPITQCAQETYYFYGNLFPQSLDFRELTTEYGERLRLYLTSQYVDLKECLEQQGHHVDSKLSPFPMHIYEHNNGGADSKPVAY